MVMKAIMLITGSGPIVILTSYDTVTDPALLAKLKAKGIERFLAYDLPLDLAKERYGGHFQTVLSDLHETDDVEFQVIGLVQFHVASELRAFPVHGALKPPGILS
jgi:hypothetical protein